MVVVVMQTVCAARRSGGGYTCRRGRGMGGGCKVTMVPQSRLE